MSAIRHYLIFLGSLILLAFISGVKPALWTAVVVVIAVSLHRSSRMVPSDWEHALRVIITAYILSLLFLGVGTVFLFRRYGWLPAVAAPVISLIYLISKEDDQRKWERAIATARIAIFAEISKSRSGAITQSQLGERVQAILARLPDQAFYITSVRGPLLSASSISPEDYKTYLELLERHVAGAAIRHRDLLHDVRARLQN